MVDTIVQLSEAMWCPFCLGMEPHRLYLHDDGVTEWCQTCLRVHLYEVRGTAGVWLLRQTAICEL